GAIVGYSVNFTIVLLNAGGEGWFVIINGDFVKLGRLIDKRAFVE
ncbi:MAG: hypothetical protein ACI8R8_003063, partial [Paraglaciecola sp.]